MDSYGNCLFGLCPIEIIVLGTTENKEISKILPALKEYESNRE